MVSSGSAPPERRPVRPGALGAALRPGASTDEQIAHRQAAVRAAPNDADGYTLLAGAYLQKVRETGDVGYYARAESSIERARALAPASAGALTERGALRLARHDFRGALSDGLRAHRLAPEVVKPYAVIVDAYVELGRYADAGRALQRMIDLKPDLASYARVSYFRELHGDLAGAVEAMELAVAASGGAPEDTASVQTLLGDLELARGRHRAAVRAYRDALARVPSHVPARVGLARASVARGDLDVAIRTLRDVVDRLPEIDHIVALAEAELAAERSAAARRDLRLVRVRERLLKRAGVNTDAELAIFEADHGDPQRAVRLAHAAWRSAPSVHSADAVGWALTQAGSPVAGVAWGRRALRLGTRDPSFLYHAGISARAAGRRTQARRLLRRALRLNPRFSPLHAPRARRALEAL